MLEHAKEAKLMALNLKLREDILYLCGLAQ
jgi:hypothetical protein